MSAALKLPPCDPPTHAERLARTAGVTTPSTALSAMNAGTRRSPRVRDLSHVQRERDEAGAAVAALHSARPLKPPPALIERPAPSTAGAHVLQQEIKRGIIGRRRVTQLWESGVTNGFF